MPKKKPAPNRADELLDELLADCQRPEEILGESGLLKQLTTWLVERAFAGELNHHLKTGEMIDDTIPSNNRLDT